MPAPRVPSSRYRDLPTVTVDDRVSLAQRPPVNDPLPPDSIIHTIVGDETLDLLAFRYYGREDLWWRIADANPWLNSFALVSGVAVAIPPLRIATRMSAPGKAGGA
jgi:phage tail protein X